MKKILILTKVFPQQRLIKWINSFKEKGTDVLIVTTGYNEENNLFAYNIPVIELNRSDLIDKTLLDIRFHKNIQHSLKRKNFSPDIIFVRDIFFSRTALQLKKIFNCKLILDIADNYPEVLEQLYTSNRFLLSYYNFIERKAILGSDITITVTEESKKNLIKKHLLSKQVQNEINVVRNIPINTCVTKDLTKTVKSSNESIKFVYIGKYSKGIRDIKPIIRAIENSKLNTKFYFLSKDSDLIKEEIKIITSNEYSLKKFHFIEPVKNSELHNFLKNFDVGLVPHVRGPATDLTEPNKLYDYCAAGLPILASDNPSLVKTIEEQNIGICYSPESSNSIMKSIEQIVTSYDCYQQNSSKFIESITWDGETKEVLSKI